MSTDPTYDVVAQVGEIFVDRLYKVISQVKDIKPKDIALTSPDDATGTHRVTVYLYEVTRNAHHLNADGRPAITVKQNGENGEREDGRGDPLVLDLHYLVTAHPAGSDQSEAGGEATTRTTNQHELLGLIMQAVHENHILRGVDLPGDFSGGELQIDVESRSTDELTNIWSTFENAPYRPSIAYRVTPVVIEGKETAGTERVVDQQFREYS
ncbi:hypothetical protein Harman_33270 [Haloarcula mannanilytica]|uniref:Pvc16 N-terminal domain-containing protein n=1 Tax=Haloarcula mannanilytica TaxID=2509225 RepID=A0A4C2EM61_9EURY|nr:DUF4255 domain-containing protein [Haloarcula mannanilytica]GCF15392.1 hypothetical protein Harman_33270 [Haloarcula mannanilytica]